MLSLRTVKGLDLKQFKEDFNEDLLKSKKNEIEKLKELQMVEVVDDFLRITEQFFYVSNTIIVDLL